MLVLAAVLLALVPAVAILYPFLRRPGALKPLVDEGSARSELMRRWDSALAGIRSTELDLAVGNLTEDDYAILREEYMTEAALALKAMDLEKLQEKEFLSSIVAEVRKIREDAMPAGDAQDSE